jgi:hypothetical protein
MLLYTALTRYLESFGSRSFSNDYEITSNDLGEYVTVYFYNMEVDSGDVISVMAGHYGYDMLTQFGQSQHAEFGSVIGFCLGSIFAPQLQNNYGLSDLL